MTATRAVTALAWLRRWWPFLLLLAIAAAYYALFFFPPRLTGANEPDRFYHLALSRTIAEGGFPKILPQVEDLGWGAYFPDKEFLFHALTGLAWWLGGATGVMLVVPILGVAIISLLYLEVARLGTPARAAILVGSVIFLTAVFTYRITLMRPHLLAILCFCLLLSGILRNRPWLGALGAAGFALSYHALYIPLFAIVLAATFRWPGEPRASRRWLWPLAGLAAGVLLNPYFPSQLVIGWWALELALGIDMPPFWHGGAELLATSRAEFAYFGFMPLALLVCAAVFWFRRSDRPEWKSQRYFLLALSTLLVALSLKSVRAAEYALPAVLLLAGHCLTLAPRAWPIAATTMLLLVQGTSALGYYRDIWMRPQGGATSWYLEAIELLPREHGAKVFNCEWEAGSYLLYARPDLRFVDLLEPALLWHASHSKYLARLRLAYGLDLDPARTLRREFDADYVLCANPGLVRQMAGDRSRFEALGPPGNQAPIRAFRLVGDRR